MSTPQSSIHHHCIGVVEKVLGLDLSKLGETKQKTSEWLKENEKICVFVI